MAEVVDRPPSASPRAAASSKAGAPPTAASSPRAAAPRAASPSELAPAGTRGSLVIRDKVVEQVAHRAAVDVPGVVAGRSSTIGAMLGQGTPRVETTVTAGHVRSVVHIAVEWPRSLAEVAAAVRDNVRRQVTTMTGLVVDLVDVRVDSDLEAPAETPRRVQ